VFLSGNYNSASNTFSNGLKTSNLIPLTQPYFSAPFNYNGTESIANIPSDTVDWVLVEVKNSSGTTIQTKAALLKSDGTIVDPTIAANTLSLPNITTTGAYKIIVRHRNHLAIATNANINITAGASTTFDFTTNLNVKGNSQLPLGTSGKYGMRNANLNGDDRINATDKTIAGTTTDAVNLYSPRDVNLDGIFNATDKTLVGIAQDAVENL
jgi:hypothetical protein